VDRQAQDSRSRDPSAARRLPRMLPVLGSLLKELDGVVAGAGRLRRRRTRRDPPLWTMAPWSPQLIHLKSPPGPW